MTKLAFATPALLALATPAFADEVPPAKTFGIDAAVVVPVGDYADAIQIGGGVLVRYEVPAGPGFVYGRTGLIGHMFKDGIDGSLWLVPAYAGYRYPLSPSGAYVAGELGITFGYASVDTQFGEMSDSDTDLGIMLAAGLRRGKLDVRGGLFVPDSDDATGFIAAVGFDL
jgi:hypothetical protein